MRDHEQIIRDYVETNADDGGNLSSADKTGLLFLEVLLDIRQLLNHDHANSNQ